MHGRIPIVSVLALVLFLGLSSLAVAQPMEEVLAQPPFPTPTFTPTTAAATATDTPTSIIPTMTPTATTVGPTLTPSATTAGGTPPPVQPTNTPRPRGAPPTPSTGIRINRCAEVVGPQGINLGQGPGFNFGHVQIVGRGDIVFVLEGPERGDDLWWWKVVTRDGVQGWGINDHLAPYSGACFAEATQVSAAPTVLSGQVAGTSGSTTQTSGELPATGTNAGGVIAAGVLAIVLVVVGLLRRRNQDSD